MSVEPAGGERILVVRAGALGDTLMATPVARALRQRHPEAAIDFLCAEPAAPLLQRNPYVNRILTLRHRNVPLLLSLEKQRLARTIRAAGYEFAVLLESAARFHDLLRHAGVQRIRSFGDIEFDPRLHSIVNNLRVAGAATLPEQALDMDLFVAPEEEQAAERLLGETRGPSIGMHAGWGPAVKKKNQEQRLKSWGAENFIELGRMLAERGARIVLTGSSEDRAEAERIAAALPRESFVQLAGRTTVRELAAVIQRLDLLVSVDSGPAHMAAALGTPLVVLWGPAILEQVRPVSSRSPVRVVRHPVFCAPCYGTPMMKSCRRNICMEAISPQRVFQESIAVLEMKKAANERE